jgi:hypothetical protein
MPYRSQTVRAIDCSTVVPTYCGAQGSVTAASFCALIVGVRVSASRFGYCLLSARDTQRASTATTTTNNGKLNSRWTAHRYAVGRVSDAAGNKITYVVDAMGNRTAEST